MIERSLDIEIEKMCHGCILQKADGSCLAAKITPEIQKKRANIGQCEESIVYMLDTKMFPLAEISVISALRFKMAAGTWAIQVDPS